MKTTLKIFVPLFLVLAVLVGCNLDGTGLFHDVAHSKKASTHTNINLLWTDGSAVYVQADQDILLYSKNPSDPQVIDAKTIDLTAIDSSLSNRFIATRDKTSAGFVIFMENQNSIVSHVMNVNPTDYTLTLGSSSSPFTSAPSAPFFAEYGTYVMEDAAGEWKVDGTTPISLPQGGKFVSLLEDTLSSYFIVAKDSDGKFQIIQDGNTTITGLDTAEKPIAYFNSYVVTQDLTSSGTLSTTGTLWKINGTIATKVTDLSNLGGTTLIFESNGTYYLVTNSKMWTIGTDSVQAIGTEPFKTLETGTKIVSAWSDSSLYVFVTESNGVYFY